MILELLQAIFGRKDPIQKATTNSPYPWYDVMVSITGTHEVQGDGDNPVILAWPKFIASVYPEMTEYCHGYNHDEIPWCGLTVAYCMAKSGIRPQYGDEDVKRFLWADSWKYFGTRLTEPRKGAVMVFTRNGGGHVSLYEGEDNGMYLIRGGNQSDQVNITRMAKNKLTAIVWPNV